MFALPLWSVSSYELAPCLLHQLYDSFGEYFSSLNHNFIVLCELLMPCQFAQKFKLLVYILPLVYHTDSLLLGIITLQHVIQNNCWWV